MIYYADDLSSTANLSTSGATSGHASLIYQRQFKDVPDLSCLNAAGKEFASNTTTVTWSFIKCCKMESSNYTYIQKFIVHFLAHLSLYAENASFKYSMALFLSTLCLSLSNVKNRQILGLDLDPKCLTL